MMFDCLNGFHILDSCALEELYSQPSSTLSKFLESIKKDSFDNNDRIIFYNFTKIDTNLLDHLYQTLIYVDIPEFFVLVISNQQDTMQYLNNKLNVILVDHPLSKATSKIVPIFNTSQSLCAHAWAGIHLRPNGTAAPCCDSLEVITKPNGIPYNIKLDTIDEFLNSKWMQDLRQSFRSGERSKNCVSCWQREDRGQDSRRTLTPYKLENIYGNINWEDGGQLMYLGGHLGTLCNLKCRICSSEYSSSIANEYLAEITFVNKKNSIHYQTLTDSKWVFEDQFWELVKNNANRIKNYEFLGGEPFMLNQNSEFLKFLVDNNLSIDTIFYFSTNGTQYPEILDYVDYFKRLELTISIDNIGKRFELERCNAEWATVEGNLTRMIIQREKFKNLKIDLCITVNIQNVLYLSEILSWVRSVNIDSYYFNYVNTPKYLAITNLTDNGKELVINTLTTGKFTTIEQFDIDATIDIIKNSQGSDGVEFVQQMQRFDRLRNQDFSKTHSDIAKAMGYQ